MTTVKIDSKLGSNEQLRQELRDIAAGLDEARQWTDGD